MKKGEELVGLSVMTVEKGDLLGEIVDVIYMPVSRKLVGFLITKDKNKYFIASHNIKEVGRDVVIVNDPDCLQECHEIPGMGIKCEGNTLAGQKVVTTSGRELGIVSDLVIDEKDLSVVGYEISSGLIQDLLEGRDILSLEKDIQYGKDGLILNDK